MILTSGLVSLAPLYGNFTYCATKVFSDYLARGLSIEEKEKIDVLSLRPGFVRTPLLKFKDK